jgi:hypothetical protein
MLSVLTLSRKLVVLSCYFEMNFKESEVVQQEVKVINSMQDQLAEMTLAFPAMSADEREEYVNLIEALLEKQRILWMRVELSKNDDETAALMASDVRKVMDAIGIPKDVCVKDVFNNIDEMIDTLKRTIAELD